jgi:transcriptional regulator with PAS, ATPase and Fis domain
MRIGGLKEIDLDFRVIAATNRDLEQLVEQGLFRRDLYYRLNILPVYIPPLRERRDDIIALVGHFLRMFNSRYGVNKTFSDPVLKIFSAYEWPGNGRELANLIERLLVMSPHDLIIRDDLPLKLGCRTGKCDRDGHEIDADYARMKPNVSLRRALEDFELNLIRDALRENQTLRQAADDLEIDLSTLVRKKRKYRL